MCALCPCTQEVTRNASKNETAVEPQLRQKATFFWAKVNAAVTANSATG